MRDWTRADAGPVNLINATLSCDQSLQLDFGAGIGNSVPYVRKHLAGAELTCLDLSQRSLEVNPRCARAHRLLCGISWGRWGVPRQPGPSCSSIA